MFLRVLIFRFLVIFFLLWGDFIKTLIFLEIVSLILIMVLILGLKNGYFSFNYFFRCLIFLVCESRIGFLLFIFYISMESELVKKIMFRQF